MNYKIKIGLLLAIVLPILSFSSENNWFEKGNEAFENGNFRRAILLYDSVENNHQYSAELYFNKANAFYNLNLIGESVLYYEKALKFSPDYKDAKHNLAIASQNLKDEIVERPQLTFVQFFKKMASGNTSNQWTLQVIIAFWVVFLALVLMLWVNARSLKYFFGGIAFLAFLACIVFWQLASQQFDVEYTYNSAIVLVEEIQVKEAPDVDSKTIFKLHEGAKVELIDAIENWQKIEFNQEKSGWISSKSIGKI